MSRKYLSQPTLWMSPTLVWNSTFEVKKGYFTMLKPTSFNPLAAFCTYNSHEFPKWYYQYIQLKNTTYK